MADIAYQRIKVAEIITRLDWSGAPDIVEMICTSLPENSYSIKLITGPTRYSSDKTERFFKEFGNNIISIPWLRRDINPFLDLLAFLSLYKIFRREKFDIIHTHTAKAGALGRLAGYASGNRRIIHMPHGHNFYGYFNIVWTKCLIFAERLLSTITHKFITLSEMEKDDLVKFRVAKPEKIRVINSGLDLKFKNIDLRKALEKKRQLGFDAHHKTIGIVSRLEPVKGVMYFVEAISDVAKKFPNARFLIVGEGSLRSKVEQRVRELGLTSIVVFTGWRDDALEIISFLDILVQPSLNEAIGRVLLEAQGLGIPVVATRVGGIPEIVKDGATGILVPAQDEKLLAQAIGNLLEDDERRTRMGEQAKAWIDEKFSARKMFAEINALYREVAST